MPVSIIMRYCSVTPRSVATTSSVINALIRRIISARQQSSLCIEEHAIYQSRNWRNLRSSEQCSVKPNAHTPRGYQTSSAIITAPLATVSDTPE